MVYHNSFQSDFRKPMGAVEAETVIELSIDAGDNYESCDLRLWSPDNNEMLMPMEGVKGGFRTKFTPGLSGVYWYYFILVKNSVKEYYCCCDGYSGGEGRICEKPLNSFQATVYNKGFKTPDWYKNSIMYQIFPDRFCREGINYIDDGTRILHKEWNDKPYTFKKGSNTNDFFAGNIRGIRSKLDYLKSLGVTLIYLNPVFESSSNHRYDTGDYMKIDYMLGTEEEFRELIEEARASGIRIILDGVFNHTGSDSIYFNKYNNYKETGAYQSVDSKYYDWFHFTIHPYQYDSWWGITTLPNVNENVKGFRDFIYDSDNSVIKKWMSMGIAGWRLDVADELPEEFLKGFFKREKEIDPEAVLIGEVWEDASSKLSYGKIRNYCSGDQFDSFMNYPLRNLLVEFITYGYPESGFDHFNIDAESFCKRVTNMYHNYPGEIFYSLMNLLDTHDTGRILTVFEEWPYEKMMPKKEQREYKPDERHRALGIKRLKMAWAFMICFPGVPCIYYGDEIFMEGYRDPFNRGTYPWGNENKEGLEFYTNINKLRKDLPVLLKGDLRFEFSNDDVVAFSRNDGDESLLFIMNRSLERSYQAKIELKGIYREIGSDTLLVNSDNIEISPLSFKIYYKKK